MNEDASKLDLLILSYCHFAAISVRHLLARDVNEILNMPHHGLDRDSFSQRLLSLVERGWLEVHFEPHPRRPGTGAQNPTEVGSVEDDQLPDVVLDRRCGFQKLQQAVYSTSNLQRHLRIALTPEGGLEWERFAHPRWYLFVEDRGDTIIDGRFHLIVRTRTRRVAVFVSELLHQLGWRLRPKPIHSITPLEPWKPFSWKQFPCGYQLLIDLRVEPGSPTAEAYEEGICGIENSAADIMTYACSLWDLEFRSRLDELRFRASRYRNN